MLPRFSKAKYLPLVKHQHICFIIYGWRDREFIFRNNITYNINTEYLWMEYAKKQHLFWKIGCFHAHFLECIHWYIQCTFSVCLQCNITTEYLWKMQRNNICRQFSKFSQCVNTMYIFCLLSVRVRVPRHLRLRGAVHEQGGGVRVQRSRRCTPNRNY